MLHSSLLFSWLSNVKVILCIQVDDYEQQLPIRQKESSVAKRSLQQLESDSSFTEDVLKDVISKLQKRLDQTSLELEAAKEEIAVKVAQVKQYQKQVEANKQQVCVQVPQI